MIEFKNRKASFEYFFLQELECGIVLKGTEIKSIRLGKINFKDSYAKIIDNEVWLFSMHISPYEKTTYFNHEPERKRKLLLHKREIKRLKSKIDQDGVTLIPKSIHINEKGKCKVILCLAKGKKMYDKRDTIQSKDLKRDIERRMKAGE
ncbi:MAG: SsrA-binding protein SmpB [Candidatus Cloacimonetes bacterium]|jgi:SsrA-binding protein|nr:SsrA-binding protein SmpB [Candidatus Cloacimonadota bacterium]MDD4157023.1 SsrA-binding protein SmpB [Candidatus Cloacimonadota bacterium]